MIEPLEIMAKKITSEMKCNCSDCLRHVSELLGSLVYETCFCEMKHKVLLETEKGLKEGSKKFYKKLNIKCLKICRDVSNEVGYLVVPICLPRADALRTPLDTKFLYDIISFNESYPCIAFKSHYTITILIQKLVYAMKLAIDRLSQHNRLDELKENIKYLLITVTTALKSDLDKLEERRQIEAQNRTAALRVKRELEE